MTKKDKQTIETLRRAMNHSLRVVGLPEFYADKPDSYYLKDLNVLGRYINQIIAAHLTGYLDKNDALYSDFLIESKLSHWRCGEIDRVRYCNPNEIELTEEDLDKISKLIVRSFCNWRSVIEGMNYIKYIEMDLKEVEEEGGEN